MDQEINKSVNFHLMAERKVLLGFAASSVWLLLSSLAFAQSAVPEAQTAPVPGPRLSAGAFSSEPQMRGNRIVRSVQANGIVAFGDQFDAGATDVKTIQYMSYSSPESLRKAQEEREYWRKQSESLRQRQAARDRELETAKLARQQEAALLLAQGQTDNYYGWRPVVGLRNFPPVQIVGVAPVYVGSPGLAGASGGFLSSGFAGRR
jgi:hypothetical protein